jgi:hypothetical protein
MRGLILVAIALMSSSALSQDRYLCVPELATGFSFNKQTKRWSQGSFKIEEKFIVRKATSEDATWNAQNAPWVVMKLGQKIPTAWCKAGFDGDNLLCDGFEVFKFNKSNLRFLSGYIAGYWADDLSGKYEMNAEGANTPMIQIGRCSAL